MVKKNYSKFKFPKIPKNILFTLLFLITSLVLLKAEGKIKENRVLGLQFQATSNQKTIYAWEQILSERPDYRDGWVQLASLYFQQGDKKKAQEAIIKAKEIDPNNETVLSFEKFLEN